MTINSATEFLKPQDREYKTVTITGLGEVRIQKLRKSETSKFYKWLRPKGEAVDKGRDADRDLWWIVNCVVDDTGRPFMALEHFDELRDKNSDTIDDLYVQILLFHGHIKADSEEKEPDVLGESDD